MDVLLFVFYVIVYIYTGFSLKLIDQINDINFVVNSKIKIIILVSSPILAGIVMGMDAYNASVGLMLIIGLFLSQKINVRDFKIYAIIVISSMFIVSCLNKFLIFRNPLSIIVTAIILLLAVIADEYLNEFLDSKNLKNLIFKILASIRPILKIVALLLPLLNLFTFYHTVMVFGLDIAYDMTRYFTERKMKSGEESNLIG